MLFRSLFSFHLGPSLTFTPLCRLGRPGASRFAASERLWTKSVPRQERTPQVSDLLSYGNVSQCVRYDSLPKPQSLKEKRHGSTTRVPACCQFLIPAISSGDKLR